MAQDADQGAARSLASLHLRVGWWTLLAFLTLGGVLEGLHALKLAVYLDVENETRRLMWTLAHAHGALLGLVNIALTSTLERLPAWPLRQRRLASRSLLGATVLVPGGFFLGGLNIHGGDPGLGVALLPPGALLLFLAVYLAASAATRHRA